MGRSKSIIKKQQYIRKEIYSKDLSVLLKSDTGKKIYGKFMNIADETAQAWLQGVVDSPDIQIVSRFSLKKSIIGGMTDKEYALSITLEELLNRLRYEHYVSGDV